MNSIERPDVFIDPPSKAYYGNRLFDKSDPVLNRDDTLASFIRLREKMERKGVGLHTADYLMQNEFLNCVGDYYSFGMLDNYVTLAARKDIRLKGFVIFEPPVVDPRIYRALPKLTVYFDKVYIHNTIGDGYSLEGVNQSSLRKLFWPQPYKNVLDRYWYMDNRLHRIVVVNGNHIPRSFQGELYSKRIEVMMDLAKLGVVDLYGRGWDKWWSRSSMWIPYWRNRKTLMSIYKGSCESKYEVLAQYSFSLCFENMSMKGYVTEKLFDCLYAGTIPIYLGAEDITELLPENVIVDYRCFESAGDMFDKIMQMSPDEIQCMREAGRKFIQSEDGLKYYNSLSLMMEDEN